MGISSNIRCCVYMLWVAAVFSGCHTSPSKPGGTSPPTTPTNAESSQASQPASAMNPATRRLFLVKRNGKFGYIDGEGNIVISPQFDAGKDFSEGLAAVAIKIGERSVPGLNQPIVDFKWGFINESGQIVIPVQFARVGSFSEGLAWMETLNKNGRAEYGMDKHGYVDKLGNTVVAPRLTFIFNPHGLDDGKADFKEGLAVVQMGKKQGFIDKVGRIAIAPHFDEADSFSEGLAAVQVGDKYGYIDNAGRTVIRPQFDFAGSFSEEVALIEMGLKFGYINRAGEVIRSPEYVLASPFSEGLAAVNVDDSGTSYINRDFESVIEVDGGPGGSFSEGIAVVRDGRREGFIDRTGRMITKFDFVWADKFHGGLAKVYPNNMMEYGYIDRTGKYVWRPSS